MHLRSVFRFWANVFVHMKSAPMRASCKCVYVTVSIQNSKFRISGVISLSTITNKQTPTTTPTTTPT